RGDIWRVHIRKPGHSADDVRRLIVALPRECRYKISIHDHPELAKECELGGVHLNSRNATLPLGWRGMVSRSLHTLEEIDKTDYDYAFLSPIFPSISKPGYTPTLSPDKIKAAVNDKIFALGGVTDKQLDEVKRMGFGGAAFLGGVWRREPDLDAFRLQFITHPVAERTIVHQAEEAVAGGCRWIQLRHKNADTEALINEGRFLADICRGAGATFIVDDRTDLVETVGADGVHLGKNDMPPSEARAILGPYAIIGSTANTLEDITKILAHGQSDYIGLGPLRFTSTKKNLSPTLGYDGYARILAQPVGLPVVAIGSVGIDDVAPLLSRGASGVAGSGAIRRATSPQATPARFVSALSDCALASVKHN
ncbi:MAG: thiamine phosphate synthase, partial [Muribaculaceae bacterium]|nr:thiamine phosphate synthase [Muribaculaceae bacterium]